MKATHILLALLLPALCTLMAAPAKTQRINTSETFDFSKPKEIDNWSSTSSIEWSQGKEGIILTANEWDAKIYKPIRLKPGRYVLYGRAQGDVQLLIFRNLDENPEVHLVLNAKEPFTDYVDFTIPAASDDSRFLCAWIPNPGQWAELRWMKIESSPLANLDQPRTPTPEELGKSRPTPPIVRGFMLGGDWGEGTFRDMAEWGANAARLQFSPVDLAKRHQKPLWEAWPLILDDIEQAVKNAEKYGIKLIIDLHAPPIEEIMEKSQLDQPELWRHPELESSFLRVWTDIAKRLKPYGKTIWGYDLYNEPLDRSQLPWAPKQWYPLAVKLLKAIRNIDPDVWIVFSPGPGALDRGYDGLVPLPDTRVIYTVHTYYPAEFTSQGLEFVGGLDQTDVGQKGVVHYPSEIKGVYFDQEQHLKAIAPTVEFAEKWRVPIYVGEFSVVRWAPKEDAVKWLNDTIEIFEERGWSWTYHAFREFNGWSLEHDEIPWAGAEPAPTPVNYITDRAKVIRKALEKNRTGDKKD